MNATHKRMINITGSTSNVILVQHETHPRSRFKKHFSLSWNFNFWNKRPQSIVEVAKKIED